MTFLLTGEKRLSFLFQSLVMHHPIALTSFICKTMFVWYIESHKLLTNVQCGFRSRRSTIDHTVRFETLCTETFIHNQYGTGVGSGGGGGGHGGHVPPPPLFRLGGGAMVCLCPPLLTPHFYFPLELYVYITLTNKYLAFFIYQLIILWTISIN